ncbi:MAG: efflux RND transporter periplasmic adaptor subunit [Gemmatimonadetes bacterium]|nr:efflux RND transporter periplasmic adaptor subunit [Gemmatimonadota bacterium]
MRFPVLLRSTMVTIAVTALAGCGKAGAGDSAYTEAAPVLLGPEDLFVAESRTLQNGPAISGTLTAARSATIRAEVPGIVVEALADEGQAVRVGQALGRLNDDAIRDQVLSAQTGLRTATEALVVARRNVERSGKLAQAGAVAERELEQSRWSVMNAEGAEAEATARLASAKKQLGYTRIRSPLNGIVSERNVNAGDNVSAGNPLFSVVDPSSLRLEAQVPVAAVGRLTVGTPVGFTIDGYGDRTFDGKISRINPAVDPATRQVRITVTLPNQAGRLVAGVFAQGRVAVESRTGLVVPSSAVDRRGIRPTVTRIHGGMAQRLEVALGIEDQTIDRIEITSGLAVGDTVVIGSARGLQSGTKVRPSAPAERAGSN